VEGGWHVRLIGIDADEKDYPCYEPAKKRLEELVLGKMVKLEKDRTDLDRYGRCLRYIFINGTNVNSELAGEGLAAARFYQPDVKYQKEIQDAEQRAIKSRFGCKWQN
jgi:micrococcal nuclease